MRLIFGKLALPCADGKLKGCWWRKHHLVVLDGSTLALQDPAPPTMPISFVPTINRCSGSYPERDVKGVT